MMSIMKTSTNRLRDVKLPVSLVFFHRKLAKAVRTFSLSLVMPLLLSLLSACGGSVGDAGYQDDDLPPVANAGVIGLGSSISTTQKRFATRANSEVVLTGKDSDSDYAPILSFDWVQIEGSTVTLIERSSNAVAFNTPSVQVTTTFGFRLTVTDADGKTDTDTVYIDVNPGDDADRFLTDPRVPADELTLVAALRGGEVIGNSSVPFSIDVVTTAHWRNRLGVMDQISVNTQTINSQFPANFSPALNYNGLVDPKNPLLIIKLIRLDADDVNQHFEDENRERRLDAHELPNAYVDFQFTINLSPSVDFELFALTQDSLGADSSLRQIIHSSNVDDNSMVAPANNAFLQSWESAESVIFLTSLVRNELGLESSISANNYYSLLDPAGELTTLKRWQINAGFADADGVLLDDPETAHALYVNNFDLGFGRDMYLRKSDNGNVYSYVTNYPTIESGMEKRADFAVVAMEYSENPDPAGVNPKIVKFFAFAPDERTGDMVRVPSLNFDGGGERFVPGVCVVCHQSHQGSRDFTNVSHADLDASFMPWDMDSFLYSHSQKPELIEPTLNTANFSADEIQQYSMENQESEIRKLNLGALATYKDDPDRNEAPIQLIHGWYGDPEVALPIDELPEADFNGNFIPAGWVGQEVLYQKVIARNCRLCHTQLANKDLNFDSYAEFIGLKDQVVSYVYQQGIMPAARLPMDRFWVSFTNEESAAALLRTHLQGLGETVPEYPGLPVPLFNFNDVNPTIGDLVTMDGMGSLFSESYLWSMVAAAGSTAELVNDTGVSSVFTPDVPGGVYEVTLSTTNESGVSESVTNSITIANRAPVAKCLTADISGLTDAGLLSNVPVVANITELGDGDIGINSVINGSLGVATIDAGNQTLSYQLDNPFLRGEDSIEYQLADFDGSLSTTSGDCVTTPTAGFGHILIDSSLAGLVPTNVLASVDTTNNTFEVDVSWDSPTDVTAESYTLWRDDVEVSLDAVDQATRTFTDSPLVHGTAYSYTVRTVIAGEQSENSAASVATTLSLLPSGLSGTSISPTQIDLSWDAPAGNIASYNVYRDDGSGNTLLGSSGSAETYSDTTASGGTTYSYTVTALDSSGQESGPSNIAANTAKPEPPASLTALASSSTQIDLSWPAVSGATSYKVYRKLASAGSFPGAPLGTPGTNAFSDTTAAAGFRYDYRVGATISAEDSITFATATESTFPSAPTGFSASTLGSSTSQVTLSWTAPSGDIDSYNIYRTGTVGSIGNVTAPTVTYADTGRTSGTAYSYTVKAVAGGYESALSVGGNGATKPATPGKPNATVNSSSQITVSGYTIACSDTPSYSIKPSVGSAQVTSAGTLAVSGLTGNKSYTFAVTATCNDVPSTASTNSDSRTTQVSFADNIASSLGNGPGEGAITRVRGTVTDTSTCNSCHSDATLKIRLGGIDTTYSACMPSNLQSCDATMDSYNVQSLTANEVALIRQWITDGKED